MLILVITIFCILINSNRKLFLMRTYHKNQLYCALYIRLLRNFLHNLLFVSVSVSFSVYTLYSPLVIDDAQQTKDINMIHNEFWLLRCKCSFQFAKVIYLRKVNSRRNGSSHYWTELWLVLKVRLFVSVCILILKFVGLSKNTLFHRFFYKAKTTFQFIKKYSI